MDGSVVSNFSQILKSYIIHNVVIVLDCIIKCFFNSCFCVIIIHFEKSLARWFLTKKKRKSKVL